MASTVRVESFRTALSVSVPDNSGYGAVVECWESKGNGSAREETCSSATFSTTDMIWIALGLNPSLPNYT